MTSRRTFIASLGAAAFGSLLRIDETIAFAPPLYPPIDLSYFGTPVSPAPADLKFGYAAITWGGRDREAIEDIASVGFPGIQLRSNVLKEFGDRPAALRDLLAKNAGAGRQQSAAGIEHGAQVLLPAGVLLLRIRFFSHGRSARKVSPPGRPGPRRSEAGNVRQFRLRRGHPHGGPPGAGFTVTGESRTGRPG